jgi:hypothetical protein
MFCSRSIGRRGVTLVEMMIAMIITLMIVFAMVEAFRRIGETTTDGRAVIEMLGQMRGARSAIENDITRSTIPVAMRDPSTLLPDQYHGGFELIEGMGSDSAPGRYFVRTPSGVAYNNFNFGGADPLAAESQTLFGDLDDILWMTIRNDDVPFRGRLAVGAGGDGVWNTSDDVINTIESNLAEVIWWAELNDQPQDVDGDGAINPPVVNNGNVVTAGEGGYGEWNPGETFTIRRRVLLIRPDLTVNTNGFMSNPPSQLDEQRAFLINNDVSVHLHYDQTTHAPMRLQANSLGDLTFRWNRSIHGPIDFSNVDGNGNPTGLSGPPLLNYIGPIYPTYLPAYQSASMRGEDVVLSNVTAFDFRVWDPNVPVHTYTTLNGELPEGLVPGDPGYRAAALAGSPPRPRAPGYGAFIDLGCVDSSVDPVLFDALQRWPDAFDDDGSGADDPLEARLNPHFIDRVALRSSLRSGPASIGYVYDPWTLRYETDTYNEDHYVAGDGDNIPDDRGETEPPYPHPLKALQVRIRMYESDTRQVKQVSQNIEFAK